MSASRNSARIGLLFGSLLLAAFAFSTNAQAVSWSSISAGGDHTCAVTTGGAAYCWGYNVDGRLGDGSTTGSNVPVAVSGLGSGVTAISAGESHTCAIQSGAVKCWGVNLDGQLGDDSVDPADTPVQVVGLTAGATAVSAGNTHSCAVVSGAMYCWGDGYMGKLGNDADNDSDVPVQVSGVTSGGSFVSAGGSHSCGVVGGAGRCWGINGISQLGDGTNSPSFVPIEPTGLGSGISELEAGAAHSCSVSTTGAATCFGAGGSGRLGDIADATNTTPGPVTGLSSGVTSISAGAYHTCAVQSGQAKCWGENFQGQLGSGVPLPGSSQNAPVDVQGMNAQVTEVSSGREHSCGIRNGLARCWGDGTDGELGHGVFGDSTTSVTVSGSEEIPPPPSGGGDGGGGGGTTPQPIPSAPATTIKVAKSLKVGKRLPATVTCLAGCQVTVTLKVGKKTYRVKTFALVTSGKVTIKLSKRLLKLARAGLKSCKKVSLVLTPTGGKPVSVRLKK